MNENDLMSRLVASKAIMDKTNTMKRGDVRESSQMMTQDFDIPQAKYNIPAEFLQEQPSSAPLLSSVPRENTKPVGVPTVDAIKNSRLPDEIKRLMIEHPIAQPQQQQSATLSNDLIEKASRLMKSGTNNYVPDSAKPKQQPVKESSNLDLSKIQQMIEAAVEKALQKNGMLVESTEKTGEVFSFRVGKHVFEGKVTKIKKLS
jgi:hypothetical protein